jgi:hypothetical protein
MCANAYPNTYEIWTFYVAFIQVLCDLRSTSAGSDGNHRVNDYYFFHITKEGN